MSSFMGIICNVNNNHLRYVITLHKVMGTAGHVSGKKSIVLHMQIIAGINGSLTDSPQ